MQIELNKIRPPSDPLRNEIDTAKLLELAHSISRLGLLQPIGLAKGEGDTWTIVYGHRRYLAHEILNREFIEAIEISDSTLQVSQATRFCENSQREELTPLEEAYALEQLIRESQIDIAEAAKLTGKNPRWIRARLQLLELSEPLQAALQDGLISQGIALQLHRLPPGEDQNHYLDAAMRSGCTESLADIWISAALLAVEGVQRARASEAESDALFAEPQRADQKYTCFVCAESTTWRRVNFLTCCGSCQDTIVNLRHGRAPDQPPTPLDMVV